MVFAAYAQGEKKQTKAVTDEDDDDSNDDDDDDHHKDEDDTPWWIRSTQAPTSTAARPSKRFLQHLDEF